MVRATTITMNAKEEGDNAKDKAQDDDDDDGGGDDADPPGPPLHHFESCWPAQSWQGRPGKGPAPRDISPPWTVCWPLVVPAAFFHTNLLMPSLSFGASSSCVVGDGSQLKQRSG